MGKEVSENMQGMKTRNMFLILAGIALVLLSQLINGLSGRWLNDPFLFPAAFAITAIYGWWSRSYIYSFLVGFFAIPYLVPFPPFHSECIPYTFIATLLGQANYNLVEQAIFLGFGIAGGFIGMGLAKLSRCRTGQKRNHKRLNGDIAGEKRP